MELANKLHIDNLQKSASEASIVMNYCNLYGLNFTGVLERNNVDLIAGNTWGEFKRDNFSENPEDVCTVISQVLHYMNTAWKEGRRDSLPDHFFIADKNTTVFYRTSDFSKYILNNVFFEGTTASGKKHFVLDKLLLESRDFYSSRYYDNVSHHDLITKEFEKCGVYEELRSRIASLAGSSSGGYS